MNPVALAGQCAIVMDRKTKRVIAAGLVVDVKGGEFNLISFDRIVFFHAAGNSNYRVVIVPSPAIDGLTVHPIPASYDILPFNRNRFAADVYLEKSEYDPEVVDLIHALNAIPGVSTSCSCSGHERDPLFVTLFFEDVGPIYQLASLIEKHGLTFTLSTDSRVFQDRNPGKLHLRLQTKYIGNAAYEESRTLATLIKEMMAG